MELSANKYFDEILGRCYLAQIVFYLHLLSLL